MRTTLEIDDDVLLKARELARQRGVTLGLLVSDLVRQSLAATALKTRNGFLLFASKAAAAKADLRLVNELRE